MSLDLPVILRKVDKLTDDVLKEVKETYLKHEPTRKPLAIMVGEGTASQFRKTIMCTKSKKKFNELVSAGEDQVVDQKKVKLDHKNLYCALLNME